MPTIECDVGAARERLADAGVAISPGNTEYERWRAEGEEATAVAYDDKVVVQGQETARLAGVIRQASGRVYAYFDGAAQGDPGPAAVGWVLVTDDGILAEGGERIGRATTNEAEYEALLTVLETAAAHDFEAIQIRGDSEMVVAHVRGKSDAGDPAMRERRVSARELLAQFDSWSIDHVPRDVNDRADELATEALEHE
jgi:ribonuclease HI